LPLINRFARLDTGSMPASLAHEMFLCVLGVLCDKSRRILLPLGASLEQPAGSELVLDVRVYNTAGEDHTTYAGLADNAVQAAPGQRCRHGVPASDVRQQLRRHSRPPLHRPAGERSLDAASLPAVPGGASSSDHQRGPCDAHSTLHLRGAAAPGTGRVLRIGCDARPLYPAPAPGLDLLGISIPVLACRSVSDFAEIGGPCFVLQAGGSNPCAIEFQVLYF
jgi:hypothetical protein